MKANILFDHDGVLVDTERWHFKAGERALAEVGVALDPDQYLVDMSGGAGTWASARAAGFDEHTIDRLREVRDAHYQEYLRTEPIDIDGVVEDSSRGVRSAVAAGIDCAIVHTEFTASQDFTRARYRIRALGDLKGIILSG